MKNRHHTPPPAKKAPRPARPLIGNDDICLMPVYDAPRDEQVASLLLRSVEWHLNAARLQMALRRSPMRKGQPVDLMHGKDAVGNLHRAALLLRALADLERAAEIAALLPEPADEVL